MNHPTPGKSAIETYLDHVEGAFGRRGDYFKVTDETQRPHVWVISYRDWPEPGQLTALTYGLSSVEHRQWTIGRPEVLISVNSSNSDWALAAGFMVKRYRNLCPFAIGSILRFGGRITEESHMSAFLVFFSDLLTPDEATITLPDRRVNVVQLYPIYEEEIGLVEREGAAVFFSREDIDFSDVRRANVGERRD